MAYDGVGRSRFLIHRIVAMQTYMPIDPTFTVNEVIERYPEALPVFARFGLDSCCGGARPLGEVALRHGLDVDDLIAAVEAVVSEP